MVYLPVAAIIAEIAVFVQNALCSFCFFLVR
jgi:hypothetical protein